MPRWNYYKKEQPAPITDLEQRLLKIEGVTEEGEMDTEDVLFLLRNIEKWEETFPYDVPVKQQTRRSAENPEDQSGYAGSSICIRSSYLRLH